MRFDGCRMQRTITALKVQKNNSNRVNVYLDGEFSFGLYLINARNLSIGMELPEEFVQKLLEIDQIEDGFQKCLRYISYKPRTKFEINKKLKEKNFSADQIDVITSMLLDKGYIDDFQYAKNWIENRAILKPRSNKLIAWELRNKKISDEIINQLTTEMVSEEELINLAAEKYARRLSGYEKDIFFRKLTGYLIRRGFSYSNVTSVVQSTWKKSRHYSNEN